MQRFITHNFCGYVTAIFSIAPEVTALSRQPSVESLIAVRPMLVGRGSSAQDLCNTDANDGWTLKHSKLDLAADIAGNMSIKFLRGTCLWICMSCSNDPLTGLRISRSVRGGGCLRVE